MVFHYIIRFFLSIWHEISRFLFLFSVSFSVCYGFGWIDRLLWFLAERTASQALNWTPVTIGSIEVDIIRGRLWLKNVVAHTPKKNEWKWKSPLVFRIGSVYVESNFVVAQIFAIFSELWCLLRNKTAPPAPLEIYTLEISDVQVFIERKQHIFNFYLMDPFYEIPDPRDILEQEQNPDSTQITSMTEEDSHVNAPAKDSSHQQFATTPSSSKEDEDEKKAQKLVAEMLLAVKTLGHAAESGSIKGALAQHRDTIKSKIKEIQETNISEAMQEGVRVIKRVGRKVAKTTKGGVLPIPKRRTPDPLPFNVRVGRIIIQDARLFTMTNNSKLNSAVDEKDTNSSSMDAQPTWNKPVGIQEIIIRAAELCPPMSLLDDCGKPALYQPIDKVVDVVWKRIFARIFAENTGHFLTTALGEVLDLEYLNLSTEHENLNETK